MQSDNCAPSAALREVIARHYVFRVDLPAEFELVDSLLSERAFIRVLIRGDWAALMPDGGWSNVGPMVFFGPNAKPLKVRCQGGFLVVGIAIRPGGWHTLFDRPAHHYTDQMLALGDLWGADSDLLHREVLGAGEDIAAIAAGIERVLLARMATAPHRIDRAMLTFERIARFESTMKITDVCEELGLTYRVFERRCRASFGMTPKRVLRRSRFLDMATVMRGFSDPGDDVLAELRYTDQSHLTREFREFIGMTPGQFAQATTPLFTAGLELRSRARREDD